MNQQSIRVAVIGVGEFGRNHVRVWREIEGVELVGIADSDAGRAPRKWPPNSAALVIPGEDALLAESVS